MGDIDHICEVTHMGRAEAEELLAAAGSVEHAITLFFEDASSRTRREAGDAPKGVIPKPVSSARPSQGIALEVDKANHSSKITTMIMPPQNVKPIVNLGDRSLKIRCHMAWRIPGIDASDVMVEVDSSACVIDLKRAIAEQTSVPAVVQRVVFNGMNLENDTPLVAAGMLTSQLAEVAILYPRRDAGGQIVIVDNAGKNVYTLKEWSFSLTVESLKGVLKAEKKMTDNQLLVFNGLSMKDYQTLGMCGVYGGASIALLSP